ncbi:helix-turn-helix domain-containing protein [Elusimicrobiota bacterium]
MKKRMPWIAVHWETLRDDRLSELPLGFRFIWIVLLASSNWVNEDERGLLLTTQARALTERELATFSGVTRNTAHRALKRFREAKLLTLDKSQRAWRVADFGSWTARFSSKAQPMGARKASTCARNSSGPARKTHLSARNSARDSVFQPQAICVPSQPDLLQVKEEIARRYNGTDTSADTTPAPIQGKKQKHLNNQDVGTRKNVSLQPALGQDCSLFDNVSAAFLQAVGRPFNKHDEAALSALIGDGHSADEVVRAVQRFARIKPGPLKSSGIRYVMPMIRRGLFKNGGSSHSARPDSMATGAVTVGHDAAIIARRRAQRVQRTAKPGGTP